MYRYSFGERQGNVKTRSGFVSNSSSASFIVAKSRISGVEAAALLAYNISEENTDGWSIWEDGDRLRGSTNMDNDALDEYLERIEFDVRKMEWENY